MSTTTSSCDTAKQPDTVYRAGSIVEVFYRMERDGEGYFPVANFGARCLTPRFGMTDGWINAKLLEDWNPATCGNVRAGAAEAPATDPPIAGCSARRRRAELEANSRQRLATSSF